MFIYAFDEALVKAIDDDILYDLSNYHANNENAQDIFVNKINPAVVREYQLSIAPNVCIKQANFFKFCKHVALKKLNFSLVAGTAER
jgi:hypothetical protein